MTDLVDELHASPRQRITVPENHTALIIPIAFLTDMKSICLLLRRGKRLNPEDKFAINSIAGELLLAVVDAEDRSGI